MSHPTGSRSPPGTPRPTSPTPRKRKLRPWMPQKNARRRMKRFVEIAYNMVHLALPIAAKAASDAGVPGLNSALEALLEILKKIQAMKTNVEGVEVLATCVTTFKQALEKLLLRHEQLSDDMRQRIEALTKLWTRVAADAKDVKCRGMIKRFFTSNIDAKKLQYLVEEVNQSIQDFVVQAVLDIETKVHAVHQDVKATQLDMWYLTTYAKNAQYDSDVVRKGCLMGTRKEVLADVDSWFLASSSGTATTDSPEAPERAGHVLWINGMAGTGKTTVAYTIVEKYKKKKQLGANFFCSRSDAECSDPKFIFVTIAYQLCQYHTPYKELVAEIVKRDSSIITASPQRQFEELILRPLRELKGEFPTCVIVIDALDECREKNITSSILDILARHIQELGPFLFVITSRPEPHITGVFENAHNELLKNSTKPLVLHNMHLESVLDDIRLYLADGFGEIRKVFFIEDEWPSNQDLDKLAELSQGLFIFATTVLRFIRDADYGNPQEQLQALLMASVSIMHDLYREILKLAYNDVETLHQTNPRLRQVLGAITLAEEPLSAAALGGLLGMKEGDIRNTLSRLRSVLHVPEGPDEAVCFIHPTFPEFLLDQSVKKPRAFHIIPAEHHLILFSRSLVVMDGLKRNIAGIEKPATFWGEIPRLADIFKKCMPAHIVYASRFWSVHMSYCSNDALKQEHCDLLGGFLTTQMLYWLEACSLLRELDGAFTALDTAKRTCDACQTPSVSFAKVKMLLADCHRFLWTYYYCVYAAPLQVYHSALALAPTESLLKKVYTRELDSSLTVFSGVLSNWPSRRDVLSAAHEGTPVFAVAFSARGDSFVTGGGDKKLAMRKTSTRTMTQSFDGHTSTVACVTFSPDGMYVASGSGDGKVCVWHVLSGEWVHTPKDHTSRVSSVVYSADGRRLLSTTDGGEVKLWDTSYWHCIRRLDRTGNFTWQAGLSPDGGVIARGKGASMCLYNVSSTTEESLDVSSTAEVKECTFSRDGRYVAARSDCDIRIWAYADRSVVRSITTEETQWSRLAFSHDGTHIGCGSENGSVYLWRVASEDPPLVIKGHSDGVGDLAWSPDGHQIVSVAEDGDIRMSDVTLPSVHTEEPAASRLSPAPSGPPRFALAHHMGDTVFLDLPPAKVDVAHFAMAASMPEHAPTLTFSADIVDAWNTTLQGTTKHLTKIARSHAWSVITGQQHNDCSATANSSQPVSISPDGSLLAYRAMARDQMVHVCDLRAEEVVARLDGHTRYVLSIAFSPNSALIATGSKDNSVKVWDVATRSIVHDHEDHTNWVRALTFSSDSRLVASGSDDKSVHVFEAATGCVRQVFGSHRDWVTDVVFVEDDDCIVVRDDAEWIYVWDMKTGTRTHEISPGYWGRSFTLSPDGSNILVGDDNHGLHVLPTYDSGSRSWPAYAVSRDGWVYAMSPGRVARLCWLPPEWRTLLSWDDARLCCLDQERRIAVGFDVSRIPEYVEMWGSVT